jgi:hypothetical protein
MVSAKLVVSAHQHGLESHVLCLQEKIIFRQDGVVYKRSVRWVTHMTCQHKQQRDGW